MEAWVRASCTRTAPADLEAGCQLGAGAVVGIAPDPENGVRPSRATSQASLFCTERRVRKASTKLHGSVGVSLERTGTR